MASLDPRSPLRADHRFIKRLMQSTLSGKVEHVPAEFDRISRAFGLLGGSWERIFRGSPGDIDLLKRILKRAFTNKMLTESFKWEARSGG